MPTPAERDREYQRRYRQRHPEVEYAALRRWEQRYPEKVAQNNRRRYARQRDAFDEDVRIEVLRERQAGLCSLCGLFVSPAEESIDHVIPLSRGGRHTYENTSLAHGLCNSQKGSRLAIDATVPCPVE